MLKITSTIRSVNRTEILLGLTMLDTQNVSLFIDSSKTSANAQVLCVHVCAFVLAFACMQDLCVCVCVRLVLTYLKQGAIRLGMTWVGKV